MKKPIKIILWIVAILIAIPVILIATLPLWLGPIARPCVNAVAPKFTKTDFKIEKLYLNPYTCNFEIGGVRIGNPEGFSETNAVALGYFNIDIDTSSLATDVIIVENVEVSDVFFSKVLNEEGTCNLDILQENVLGAKTEADKVAEEAEKKAEEERLAKLTPEERAAEEEAKNFNKKVIVNRVLINNISGKLSVSKYVTLPIAVPSIELKDIGKDSGGYDLDHLGRALLDEFWASILASTGDLTGAIGEGAGKAVDAVKDLKNIDLGNAADKIKSAGDSLKNVGDSLKGLFK